MNSHQASVYPPITLALRPGSIGQHSSPSAAHCSRRVGHRRTRGDRHLLHHSLPNSTRPRQDHYAQVGNGRRSPFTVHRSPFTVHRSAFGVRRSAFGVRRSAFGVRRRSYWHCEMSASASRRDSIDRSQARSAWDGATLMEPSRRVRSDSCR